MKVLITGAGGQVGRALLAIAPPDVQLVPVTHIELDIATTAAVGSYVRQHAPDLIINAAAYTAVDRAESEPELAWRVNVDGAYNLALAARDNNARLIHISTDFVFDGAASRPYPPDAKPKPLGHYGATKLAGERMVSAVLPGKSVIIRTAWVYAAAGSNFVRTMLRIMKANGAARVIADQVGTPTAARSLAETLWKIAARADVAGIHHWTDAGVASWYDFAVAIAEEGAALGLLSDDVTVTPISTAEYPTSAQRPAYSVLDKSSLTALGWTPMHWRKRLRTVLEEVRNG